MLRGCFFALLLFAALVLGYAYWLDQTLERPASLIAGGVAGLGVLFCIGALDNARTAWRDGARLRASQSDSRLVDGQVIAVSGTIHPLGEPLLAPFSQTRCVICEYDLANPRRKVTSGKHQDTSADFAGFLMTPCVVRSPHGEVKLLGYPLLEGFPEHRVTSYQAARCARDYLTTHEFEDRSGTKIVTVLSVFGEVWTDDDGSVQKNMRLSKVSLEELFPADRSDDTAQVQPRKEDPLEDDEEDYDDEEREYASVAARVPKLIEKRVPVGEAVCVIGVYDELRRGLLPANSGTPNRLFRGTAEQILAQRRTSLQLNVIGAVIGLLVIHAAIFGGLALYRRSPEVLRDQQQRATQAAVHGNLDELHALVRRGFDINFRNPEGRTLLMNAIEPQTVAYLIAQGADVNATDPQDETALTYAARFGRLEIVRQLIAAQANLSPRSQITQRTPLGEAIANGHAEVAEVLRAAGARE